MKMADFLYSAWRMVPWLFFVHYHMKKNVTSSKFMRMVSEALQDYIILSHKEHQLCSTLLANVRVMVYLTRKVNDMESCDDSAHLNY